MTYPELILAVHALTQESPSDERLQKARALVHECDRMLDAATLTYSQRAAIFSILAPALQSPSHD